MTFPKTEHTGISLILEVEQQTNVIYSCKICGMGSSRFLLEVSPPNYYTTNKRAATNSNGKEYNEIQSYTYLEAIKRFVLLVKIHDHNKEDGPDQEHNHG